MTQSTPPGWYPDGQGGQRWWDGNQWTDHVQPAAESSDRPTASEPPAQPGPADETRVRPPEQPSGDRPAPTAEEPPAAAAPTQLAGAPGAPQPAYPGQPGQAGQPGQPGQPAWQGQQYGGGSGGGGVNTKLIAIIGAGVLAVLVLVVVLVLVLGGGSGSPKEVVEDFIDADSCSEAEDLVSDDFIDAQGECDEDSVGSFDDEDIDVEVKNEKIDGDEATVDVELSAEFEGEEQSQTLTFELVKEDGDWKIDDFS